MNEISPIPPEREDAFAEYCAPADPHSVLDGLNEAQRKAVMTTEGYVRVIAGAGSGKTRALSHRFAYLVNELGIMPGNILCVTFTNKAANEMRQRIHRLTGDNDTGYVNTFHGFCVSVLQEDSSAVSYPKSFLVLDNSDIDAMLGIIYEERGLTLRDMTFSRARDMIEIRKIFSQPDYYRDMITMSIDTLKRKYLQASSAEDIIFYGYLYQEKKCFGLDYNDLIKFTLYVFEMNEEIKLKWQKRLEYIMIDEFQDIDNLQYRLMEALCGYHGNLFVVGDPDQTIYTWRGANVRYLLDFPKRFPGTQTIMMNDNYRSTPQIAAVANSLIDQNHLRMKKHLTAQSSDGPRVLVHHAPSDRAEAEWIAEQIRQMQADGVAYRDICILYRAHYVTRSIEEVFQQEEIPYTIHSGVQFFDRREVKDALSYLRMVQFKDDLSFERIVNQPKRNIGERRMKFLRTFAEGQHISLYQALCRSFDDPLFKGTKAREFIDLVEAYSAQASTRPVSELLAQLLDKSGYEEALRTEGSQERLDNLAELRQSVYEYETQCGEEARLDDYLSHVALFSNLDKGLDGDKVKMMTIHAAKGLEFPHVIIAGLSEGILPSRKTKTVESMEEERRLCFVAVTRAQKSLALTCAGGNDHEGIPRYPSRFIMDIDPDLLDYTTPFKESLINDAKRYYDYRNRLLRRKESTQTFVLNSRVVHPVFGIGTITGIDPDSKCYEIQFDRMETPRNLSFGAKLTRADEQQNSENGANAAPAC
ncbi:MAG: ATP-dependent helicase [Eggerthellaceae bacterium]|jgi:DNA helicase-2/ATP-dependent DNA helicase PcrA